MITVFFSCKSTSIAQEKESTTETKKRIEKPKFGDSRNVKISPLNTQDHILMAPSTIRIMAIVKNISKNQSVCGSKNKTAVTLEIKNIIASGSSIVNMVSLGQDVTMSCTKNLTENLDVIQEKITDQPITFTVKEGLCFDSQKSSYEIMGFTPLK